MIFFRDHHDSDAVTNVFFLLFSKNRKHTRKYTILVTDDPCSQRHASVLGHIAARLKSSTGLDPEERTIWSIGAGNADRNELNLISGDKDKVIMVDNYGKIEEIEKVKEQSDSI